MLKRGEILDKQVELKVKYGQLEGVSLEDINAAKIIKKAYIQSILEDIIKFADADITQEEFNKIASKVEKEISVVDAMAQDQSKFSNLVLEKIASVATIMDKENTKQ